MSSYPQLIVLALLLQISCENEFKSIQCPTWKWFNYSSAKCQCGDRLSNTIQCNSQENGTVFARFDTCVFVDRVSKYIISGTCKYKMSYTYKHRIYSELPSNPHNLTITQCSSSNREGLFCGKCKKGYAPSLHIIDRACIECSACLQNPITFLKFVLAEILPLTAFYLIIIGGRINILSGPIFGYIVFCQAHVNLARVYPNMWNFIFSKSGTFLYFWNTKMLLALAGIWNLDFFVMFLPNVCAFCEFNNLMVILWQYFSVVYIFLLLLLTYLANKLNLIGKFASCTCYKVVGHCFTRWRQNWNMSDSTVHAFATFTALACAKVGAISTQILEDTEVHNINGTIVRAVPTFEPDMDILRQQHIPFVIVAYFFIVIFNIPAFVLCLYPSRYFQRVLRHCCGPRNRLALGIFVDTICSGYRDGLNGGRDYRRLYPSSLIVITVGLFIVGRLSQLPETYFIFLFPVFILLSFLTLYIRPCKTRAMNASLSFHLTIMGLSGLVVALWIQDYFLDAQTLEIALTVILTLPHVVVLLWLMYIVLQQCGTVMRN